MKEKKEVIKTMTTAIKYAFAFCWRNAKSKTLVRVILATILPIFTYLTAETTKGLINVVNKLTVLYADKTPTVGEIFNSGLRWPFYLFVATLIGYAITRIFNWTTRSGWNMTLRYANQRELNEHRATLDVGRLRSKAYDDLSKRIQELGSGWVTRMSFSNEILALYTSLILFFAFGASLVWYKPIYAVILLITAIPMALAEFWLVSEWWQKSQDLTPVHKRRSVLEKAYQEINTFVQALMFNQMASLRREIDINTNGILGEYDKIRDKGKNREIFTHTLANLGLAVVVLYAIVSTIYTKGEPGTLIFIITAAKTFQNNLEEIISVLSNQWTNAKGVIMIEKDFLGLKPVLNIETKYAVKPKYSTIPTLELKNVNFTYPDAKNQVLKNVNFTIKPGTKVAIVGKSGSGKSTLLSLLMRHYDPTQGDVFAEGVNLRNIEPKDWNRIASALMQDPVVLENKLGNEICSSLPEEALNQQALDRSVLSANFDEVIRSKDKGYESQIGVEFSDGITFSGGEKQRLALSRILYAVYCDKVKVIILDEPDSKLDPESGQIIMDSLFGIKDATVIIITHHVSRAERCDNIIVMDKGEVAEQGTHKELFGMNGVYTSMYKKDQERLGLGHYGKKSSSEE